MNQPSHTKEGFMLLISMSFVLLLSAGAFMLLHMSTQKAFTETKRANISRAKILAENGVHRTYSLLQSNPELMDSAFEEVSVGEGSYQISIVEESAGEGSGNLILLAQGRYGNETSEAAIAIEKSDSTSSSSDGTTETVTLGLFDAALFCGGDAKMTGGSYIDLNGGVAHINGTLRLLGSASFRNQGLVSSSTKVDMSGGNAKIYADVAAPLIPLPSWAKWGSPTDFITGSQTIMDVPEQMVEIDLEPFFLYAKKTDQTGSSYKSNKMKWNSIITDSYISADELQGGKLNLGGWQVLKPSGGVVWIEGSVDLGGSSTVEGCIVATGDIKIAGGMTHINPNGLPSYMSTDGDIDLVSGCTAYGLLYAHNGDIKIAGDATVEGGAFIAPRGSFDQNGSGKILYANSHPYGPEGETVTLPKPEVTIGESIPPKYLGWIK